jgi:hypothetical protein
VRLILYEYKTRDFKLVQSLMWINRSIQYYCIMLLRLILLSFCQNLSGSFWDFPRDVSDSFSDHLDVDLLSLFIVEEPSHRV